VLPSLRMVSDIGEEQYAEVAGLQILNLVPCWPADNNGSLFAPWSYEAGGAYVPTLVVGMYAPFEHQRGTDMPKNGTAPPVCPWNL